MKIGMLQDSYSKSRGQWRTVVNTVLNFRVPEKAGNFLTSRVTVGFSTSTLLLVIEG
jgi:hypothetical protein